MNHLITRLGGLVLALPLVAWEIGRGTVQAIRDAAALIDRSRWEVSTGIHDTDRDIHMRVVAGILNTRTDAELYDMCEQIYSQADADPRRTP